MATITPEQIDALLPQTQCGLCGYGGCMPYAEAMVFEKASINLCPPGGQETLIKLGTLLDQDPSPFMAEMQQKAKPPLLAIIREDECIGCTKCIQACPVDAILGGAKLMHTIIASECTGCELCVPACPVDCIEITTAVAKPTPEKMNLARERFNHRNKRLNAQKRAKQAAKTTTSLQQKNHYIQAAIARAQAKKQPQ